MGRAISAPFSLHEGLSASWQGSGENASHPFASCASVSPLILGELLLGSGVTFSEPVGNGPVVGIWCQRTELSARAGRRATQS